MLMVMVKDNIKYDKKCNVNKNKNQFYALYEVEESNVTSSF